MSTKKPKHVERFVDRYGRARYYFRRGKGGRTPLPGDPNSDAFKAAYAAAPKAETHPERKVRGHQGLSIGSCRSTSKALTICA